MTERQNRDIALRYWSDPTLKAWFWFDEAKAWLPVESPCFDESRRWNVGHTAPTAPPVKTCELAGVKFPMPMREAPPYRSRYWAVMTDHVASIHWDGTPTERRWLELRLCHTSQSAADQHYKAINAANQQAIEGAK